MSKYVKYISSEHFGAPEMKGDRWGYCVEMLRKCLVEGFNQRTDLVEFNVLSSDQVKFSFTSEHMYVESQTIKVSGMMFPELNNEFEILSSTPNDVTCKSYIDLSSIVGQKMSVTGTSIVAPLGFIEKFRDVNRSVFTTDEDEAYFYIDDTQPDNWVATGTYTQGICPIVYMTDKMIDIDTPGRVIFPYDSANPDHYKKRGFNVGTTKRNGIMNFVSYGHAHTTGNNATQRVLKLKYSIIGNGRLFYFLPEIADASLTLMRVPILGFGKYNNNNKIKDKLPYILFGNSYTYPTIEGAYSYYRNRNICRYLNNTNGLLSISETNNTDIGKSFWGILSVDGKPSPAYFSYSHNSTNSFTGAGLTSGFNQQSYPDVNTNKFSMSKIRMFNMIKDLGSLPGILWVFNGSTLLHLNGKLYKYRVNSETNVFYCHRQDMATTHSNNSVTDGIYMFSLNYKDWGNYE